VFAGSGFYMRSARFITSGGEEACGMSSNEVSRTRPGVVLVGVNGSVAPAVEARWSARGYPLMRVDADADLTAGLARVAAAIAALRAASPPRAVAVAGYGDGGRYAFLAVTRLGADAAAAFLGAGISAHLDEARFARVPMSLHFADDDAGVPPADVRAIKGALEGIGVIDVYRYAHWDGAAEAQAEARAFSVLDTLEGPLR
jgi:dienelactone hydrolase